jgi:hypothetical protein
VVTEASGVNRFVEIDLGLGPSIPLANTVFDLDEKCNESAVKRPNDVIATNDSAHKCNHWKWNHFELGAVNHSTTLWAVEECTLE